jgi:predicted permease
VTYAATDFRTAWRTLRRDWGSSLFIVVTLALGVGANAALFGVIDRLLLTGPEQIQNPQQVHRLYWTRFEGPNLTTSSVFDYPALDALQSHTRRGESVAAYATLPATFGRGRDARQVTVGYVSRRFFTTLRTPPLVGRTLDTDSAEARTPTFAIVSYDLWRSALGGAADVIGRTVVLDERAFQIVGVMPQGFTGAEATKTDFWVPIENASEVLGKQWNSAWDAPWAFLIARLPSESQVRQANAEFTAAFRHAYAGTDSASLATTIAAEPLTRNPQGNLSPEQRMSLWLGGLSVLVVLIAGVNISNLLSARAMRRRASLGIRVALGASRADILRLFIAEGILLAVAGGVASFGVAYAVGVPLRRQFPPAIVWTSPIISARIVALVLCSVLIIGVGVAIIPARRIFGMKLTILLQTGGRSVTNTAGQGMLTVVQSALSMILLLAAGWFLHSVLIARSIDFGIDPQHVTAVFVQWPRVRRDNPAVSQNAEWNRRTAFLQTAAQRFRAAPEIQSVAVVTGYPLGRGDRARITPVAGPFQNRLITPSPRLYVVSDHYFETIGTRIEEGRPIEASDGTTSARVVVVSRSAADKLWPGTSALGQRVRLGADSASYASVVGVVANTRSYIGDTSSTQVYAALAQSKPDNMWLLVRSTMPPARLTPLIRTSLSELDASIDYVQVASVQSALEPTLRPWKLGTMFFGLIGALAFVIAAVGLYGVVSYNAVRREPELGIRRALGASPANIVRLIVRGSFGAATAGVCIGAVVGMTGMPYLQSMLYPGLGRDPAVVMIVGAGLLATAIISAGIPAFRILRRSPAEALRAN